MSISIPVPLSGVGLAVAIASLGSPKTFVFTGDKPNAITLEFSLDGSNWATVATFIGPSAPPVVIYGFYSWVRVRRLSGADACTLDADADGAGMSPGPYAVPVPASGVTSFVDVHDMIGPFSFIFSATDSSAISVEISQDFVDWAPLRTLNGPSPAPFLWHGTARGVRARRLSGSGVCSLSVGGGDPAALVGPVGATGATGATGPLGPTGATGATGATGSGTTEVLSILRSTDATFSGTGFGSLISGTFAAVAGRAYDVRVWGCNDRTSSGITSFRLLIGGVEIERFANAAPNSGSPDDFSYDFAWTATSTGTPLADLQWSSNSLTQTAQCLAVTNPLHHARLRVLQR
jgi:hypothetical protein